MAVEPDSQIPVGLEHEPSPVLPIPPPELPADDPAVPVAAIASAAPRFCGKCGAAWQPEWTACPSCVAKSQRVIEPLAIGVERSAINSAVALYFALLAVCGIGMLCASRGNELPVEFGVCIGLSAVTLIWCAVSWRSVLPALVRWAHPAWFGAALGLSLVTFTVATSAMNILHQVAGLRLERMSEPFLVGGWGWGMVILCVCVEPAVVEELAFRGVIFGALQKILSPFETIMVSAMMFMILHLSVPMFPHTLVLGVASGFLRTRTRSLYPCILLHFSHNLLCVLLEWAMR